MWEFPFLARSYGAFAECVAFTFTRRIPVANSVAIAGFIAVSFVIPFGECQPDRYNTDCDAVRIGYTITSITNGATASAGFREPADNSKLTAVGYTYCGQYSCLSDGCLRGRPPEQVLQNRNRLS